MTLRHLVPLFGFLAPMLVVGFGVVIPRSCIAGVSELTIGFVTTVIGAGVTYLLAVCTVLPDARS